MKLSVHVMIGIAGSGKSTWLDGVRSGRPDLGENTICSADHYHLNAAGRYVYDPKQAGNAHDLCLNKFTRLVAGHDDRCRYGHVGVDNTNTTMDQVAPYIRIAQAFGADVFPVMLVCDPMTAWRRGTHEVPLATVLRMDSQLRDLLARWPSHWPKLTVQATDTQ